MLYLFDLDGTLITSYMDRPDKDYHAWDALPERRQKLIRLEGGELNKIGIITNQGGVAFGLVDEVEAWTKIGNAILAVGLRPDYVPMYACFAHPNARDPHYRTPAELARRKPSGAMIREAIRDYPHDAALGVLYVGDRPEDEAAAKDAGVSFQWAHLFFGA